MRNYQKFLSYLLLALFFSFGLPVITFASEDINTSCEMIFNNDTTGYGVYIDDQANLLSPSQETALGETMSAITEYGNAVFISIDSNPASSVEKYGQNYGYSHFGNDSYTLFIIDMDYRSICVYSNGEIYKTITSAYADTITDNVYVYATDGDYYTCAYHAFDQILTLLEGRTIAQPMKYISNALLAIVLALLINYFIVMSVSYSKKASDTQILSGINSKVTVINTKKEFLRQTKQYSPQTSSSSGSVSSSRSGGSGMSGSNGGGSHKF